MLAIHLLFSLLAGFAAAQSSNTTLDASTVDATTRNQWCVSERNTCPLLCGGPKFLAPGGNTCEQSTLTFNCTCSNGTAPTNLASYLGTIPTFECNEIFKRCNIANPGAQSCKQPVCGTLDSSNVEPGVATTSSAAASSTGDSAAATTGPAASPTTTTGAAIKFIPEMGLAAGVAAAMGLLL